MGSRTENLAAAELWTRYTTLATRQGIDPAPLVGQADRLGQAPSGARIWVDSVGQRLAVRCPVVADSADPWLGPRPGTRSLELEASTGGVVAERCSSHGPRALAEDLALLASHQVAAPVRERVAGLLTQLGGGCDRLARRHEGDTAAWLIGVEVPATREDAVRTTPAVLAIAEQFAVPPLQRRYLEQAYLALAPIGGVAIDVVCTALAVVPRIVLEVRDVTWQQAVGLADAIRPGGAAGPSFGALAGAFDADLASALELTFRADAPAWVRAAVDVGAATGVDR